MSKLSDEHWRHLYDAADGRPVAATIDDRGARRGVLTKLRRTLAQHHAVDIKTGEITDVGRQLLKERSEKGLGRPADPPAGPLYERAPSENIPAPAPPAPPAPQVDASALSTERVDEDDPRAIIAKIRDLPEDQLHPWDVEFRRLWRRELGLGLPGQEAPGVAFAFAEEENGRRPPHIEYAGPPVPAPTPPAPAKLPAPYTLGQALADLHSFNLALSHHHGATQQAAFAIRSYLQHFENYGIAPCFPGDPTRHRAAIMRLCTAKAPEIFHTARLGPKQRRYLFGHYQAAIVLLVSDDPLHEAPWARYTTDALDAEVQTALLDCTVGTLRRG